MRLHRPKPLTTRPTVSVVIPCYNYGHYLPDAVASVLDQEHVDLDVIIVDDCSTDGSLGVARRLATYDDRIRIIDHPKNRGHITTYNDGLSEIKGDYVVLLSADDLLSRNALTRAVALMEAYPTVGLVFGLPKSFETTPPKAGERIRSWSVWPGHQWLRHVCHTGRNPIMSPEVVLRRAAWDEIGEYDARLPHAADMAVWLDVALRWDVGRVNGPAQAHYRVHGHNMHLTTYAGMLTDLRERRQVFTSLFTDASPQPPDAGRLHDRARRALATAALRLADAPGGHGFTAFARETWPPIRETARWRRHHHDLARGAGISSPRRFAMRVRRHAEWRLWRRYGV